MLSGAALCHLAAAANGSQTILVLLNCVIITFLITPINLQCTDLTVH